MSDESQQESRRRSFAERFFAKSPEELWWERQSEPRKLALIVVGTMLPFSIIFLGEGVRGRGWDIAFLLVGAGVLQGMLFGQAFRMARAFEALKTEVANLRSAGATTSTRTTEEHGEERTG